jgi:Flp pilus assembly protein TadD
MGTAQVTPVATVQTERLAPAEIPSTNLGSVLPTPVFTTLPDPTVPPVPVENLDLGAFRRQLGAFAPTELKALRPKLVSAVAATKTPPHDLEVMTAQVYAYLGGRESLKEWIQYAYQTAFRAAQREPKDVEAKKALLMALLAAGKPDEVLAPAREMFALHGDDPIFAMCLGSALVRRGSGEEGLGILTTAYHKHPDSFPLGEALAKAHLDAERYAEAETTARGLLEREPNDAVIGRLIGRAFEARKKWGELVLLYEPLATANPNDWQLRFSLGRAYRMLRQFDASRTQLDGILARTDLSLGVESRAQVNLERGKVEFDQDRFAWSGPTTSTNPTSRPSSTWPGPSTGTKSTTGPRRNTARR